MNTTKTHTWRISSSVLLHNLIAALTIKCLIITFLILKSDKAQFHVHGLITGKLNCDGDLAKSMFKRRFKSISRAQNLIGSPIFGFTELVT